jgi:predicted DCC family thiol-disulfide oxidoreductase YuxK
VTGPADQDRSAAPPGPLLIFDGDCAFCTSCVRWLEPRLTPGVTIVPWQRTDLAAAGTTEERARREVLWAAESQVLGGAAAAAAALRHCRSAGWRAAGRALGVPPLRWLAPPAYRLIARNRHRLPGGTAACALPPSAR